MTKKKSPSSSSLKSLSQAPAEQYVRVRLKALEIPPVKDGIVIGRVAPIGAEAMIRTLKLMSNENFVHIKVDSADVIVRESVIRKLRQEKLVLFIRGRVLPFLADNELLMLDMEIEVVVEDTI